MKKIHLGCGSIYKNGWINIDLDSPVADIQRDLTEPLPFENDTVQYIYTEHFIEHINRQQAVSFLFECHRVLTADGVIRVSTPDLRFLVQCYQEENITEWGQLWAPDSPCNLMNEGMRSWGHTYVYDFPELTRVFTEAGFAPPQRAQWGHSHHADLNGLETRPYHEDLIVEIGKNSIAKISTQKWWKKILKRNK